MKWIAALGIVLLAACIVMAQEDPKTESAEVQADNYIKLIDTNDDGVLIYDELKTYIKKEAGQDAIKDVNDDKYAKQLSIHMPPYLAADANDDCRLTREELLSYFTSKADKQFQPEIS